MWIGAEEQQGGRAVGLGVGGARRGGVRGAEGERERRDGVVVLRAFGGVVWVGAGVSDRRAAGMESAQQKRGKWRDGQLVTIDESGRKDRRTTEHTLARTLRQRVRVGAYRAVDALREAVSVGVRAEAFQISAACLITHLL